MQRQMTSSSHKICITVPIFKFVISWQKKCMRSLGNQGGCETGRREWATSTSLQETCSSAHEMSWNNVFNQSTAWATIQLAFCCYHLWRIVPRDSRRAYRLWFIKYLLLLRLLEIPLKSCESSNSLCIKCFIIYKEDMGSRKKFSQDKHKLD